MSEQIEIIDGKGYVRVPEEISRSCTGCAFDEAGCRHPYLDIGCLKGRVIFRPADSTQTASAKAPVAADIAAREVRGDKA